MLSLHECKKILNAKEKGITDEQVKKVMEFLYFMAKIQVSKIQNQIKWKT